MMELELKLQSDRRARNKQSELEALRKDIVPLSQGKWISALTVLTDRFRSDHNQLSETNSEKLRDEVGDDVALAYVNGLCEAWKVGEFHWPSELDEKSLPNNVRVALAGLTHVVWLGEANLTQGDAERALKFATWELNQTPSWVDDLSERFPLAANILIPQFEQELKQAGRRGYALRMMRDTVKLREGLWSRALDTLMATEPSSLEAFGTMLEGLLRWPTFSLGSRSAELAAKAKAVTSDPPRFALWWTLWAAAQPDDAVSHLWLGYSADTFGAVVDLLADLTGYRAAIDFPPYGRAALLAKLAVLAHRLLPRTPTSNLASGFMSELDKREDFRDQLIGAFLRRLPSYETQDALVWMHQQPERAVWRKRLEHAISEGSARLALLPMSVDAAMRWARAGTIAPGSAHEFTGLVIDRISEIESDCFQLGEDSFPEIFVDAANAHGWRVDEPVFSKWLKHQLNLRAEGLYHVEREAQAQAEKRTDLRVESKQAQDWLVTIEVKLAEKWSYRAMLDALTNQLVGTYLADPKRRRGILLLASSGATPAGIRWVKDGLDKLILSLQSEADKLKAASRHIDQLWVPPVRLKAR